MAHQFNQQVMPVNVSRSAAGTGTVRNPASESDRALAKLELDLWVNARREFLEWTGKKFWITEAANPLAMYGSYAVLTEELTSLGYVHLAKAIDAFVKNRQMIKPDTRLVVGRAGMMAVNPVGDSGSTFQVAVLNFHPGSLPVSPTERVLFFVFKARLQDDVWLTQTMPLSMNALRPHDGRNWFNQLADRIGMYRKKNISRSLILMYLDRDHSWVPGHQQAPGHSVQIHYLDIPPKP